MLYCKNCQKEIVIYSISHSNGAEENVELLRKKIEDEGGKLILFNPPPFEIESYKCPICNIKLEETD